MKIPEYITRQQLTDAFAALGVHADAVTAAHYERDEKWIDLDIRPAGSPPAVVAVALRIPIVDAAPADEPQAAFDFDEGLAEPVSCWCQWIDATPPGGKTELVRGRTNPRCPLHGDSAEREGGR